MTRTLPALALRYNREVRAARRRARLKTVGKLLIAMALGFALAVGINAAFAEIVATRAAHSATPWKG